MFAIGIVMEIQRLAFRASRLPVDAESTIALVARFNELRYGGMVFLLAERFSSEGLQGHQVLFFRLGTKRPTQPFDVPFVRVCQRSESDQRHLVAILAMEQVKREPASNIGNELVTAFRANDASGFGHVVSFIAAARLFTA